MKAVVLESFGDSAHFKLKDVEIPQPKAGEVRIKIQAAGFNPVDFKIREGHFGGHPPLILGADCSGTIDALGANVSSFDLGDEVYAMAFGQGSNGSYAECLCLPACFVAKKPKNISMEQASAIPLVGMTAYRAILATHALKKGDSVFIAGAGGGVGSLAVELLKLQGVGEIFTVAGSEESKQHLHQTLGIKKENILLYKGLSSEQMQERLVQMNHDHLFDVTCDFVGQEMKRLCLNVTCYSGHFVTIVPENDPFHFPVWERGSSLAFGRNLSLHFVFVGAQSFSGPPSSWDIYSRHLGHLTELVEKAEVRPPSITTLGNLSAETVRQAHQLLEAGRTKGKLVMRVT